MDENCNHEVIFMETEVMAVDGIDYNPYCLRPTKEKANIISRDLISQGKHSIVTQNRDGFIVWWA
jgi:hypothetical protein